MKKAGEYGIECKIAPNMQLIVKSNDIIDLIKIVQIDAINEYRNNLLAKGHLIIEDKESPGNPYVYSFSDGKNNIEEIKNELFKKYDL